jgi:hypothetical protein
MIDFLIRLIFGKRAKTPYQCGYDYAAERLDEFGPVAMDRLYEKSDGAFNTTHSEREFDRGVRAALLEFNLKLRDSMLGRT